MIKSLDQQAGRSDGGGGSFWLGSLPSKTTQAIFNPQLKCTSKWQCMNHTPAQKSWLKTLVNDLEDENELGNRMCTQENSSMMDPENTTKIRIRMQMCSESKAMNLWNPCGSGHKLYPDLHLLCLVLFLQKNLKEWFPLRKYYVTNSRCLCNKFEKLQKTTYFDQNFWLDDKTHMHCCF